MRLPWGVPIVLYSLRSFKLCTSIYPTLSNFLTNSKVDWSQYGEILSSNASWFILSKHFSISTFIIHVTPFQPYFISFKAWWQFLPLREPNETSKNLGSKIGSNLLSKAPCTTLSIWDEMPKYLTFPLGRGIPTFLEGVGLYFWLDRSLWSLISRLSEMFGLISPSIPGLTLFFVRSRPAFKLLMLTSFFYIIFFFIFFFFLIQRINTSCYRLLYN